MGAQGSAQSAPGLERRRGRGARKEKGQERRPWVGLTQARVWLAQVARLVGLGLAGYLDVAK